MQKLGNIFCNQDNPGKDKDQAIECFKLAVELVKGDSNKEQLAQQLQGLLIEVNRQFEFTPFQKYLRETVHANGEYNDE
jgi:hypothetical protein